MVRAADSRSDQTRREDAGPSMPTNPAHPDFVVFVQLGPDLSGFQDTVHGGVLAALLDKALGLCAEATELVSNSHTRLYTAEKPSCQKRNPWSVPRMYILCAAVYPAAHFLIPVCTSFH